MLLYLSENPSEQEKRERLLLSAGIPIRLYPLCAYPLLHERVDYGGLLTDQDPMAELQILPDPEIPEAAVSSLSDDELVGEVRSFYLGCGGALEYSTFALQANAATEELRYLGYPLRLRPFAARLLICLLREAPQTVKSGVLLEFCSRKKLYSPRSLSAAVSEINKASRAISGLTLVAVTRGVGYRLADGIVKRPKPER